jgi:trimeric autotransporter adhesin
MAIYTHLPAIAPASADVLGWDFILRFSTAAPASVSATQIILTNNGSSTLTILEGTFVLTNGVVTGGTITSAKHADAATATTVYETITGLSLAASTFLAAATSDRWAQLMAGDDTLNGYSGSNKLSGGAGNDTLVGGASADTLDGGAGADSMTGGLGDDLYVVDNLGDVVVEAANGGNDTVRVSLAAYTLGTDVENLTVNSVNGAFSGTGTAANNRFTGNTSGLSNDTFYGLAGDDYFDGSGGTDTFYGGIGNDTFVVRSASDTVVELAGEGTDSVLTIANAYTLTANVENLERATVFAQVAGNFTGTGNELNNLITGNVGNDTLYGLAGNDTINGATGADTMYGGSGDDTYTFDNLGDHAFENAGEGTDTVNTSVSYVMEANIENVNLTGVGTNDGVLGNDLANIINGNSGNNGIAGGDGNDTINAGAGNDVLDGGLGADALSGGTGSDVYFLDNVGDTVLGETAQAGVYDTVWTTVSFTLPAEVEILILNGGNLAINGTGNAGASGVNPNLMLANNAANILTTFGGDDIILGLDGNDTINAGGSSLNGYNLIVGGNGSDLMTSGSGHDFFAYTNISEAGDTISGFTTASGNGLDILDLRTMFTSFTGFGGGGAGAAAMSGHLTFTQLGSDTQVYADANGGAHNAGEQILLATLTGTTAAAVQTVTLV